MTASGENSANAALYYDSSTLTQKGYSPTSVHDGDFVASQLTTALDLTHKLDIGLAGPLNIAGVRSGRGGSSVNCGQVNADVARWV